MRAATLCSGIGAPEAARPDWTWLWHAEIEQFPAAVHAYHFDNPNLGDITAPDFVDRAEDIGLPDVLIAGCPCQAFSVAGLRKGLDDARGNLTLRFCQIVDKIDERRAAAGLSPLWVLYENVPGILSDRTNAFGCLMGALCGSNEALLPQSKWTNAGVVSGPARTAAWRILDARHFGVTQRRRRVFCLARGGAGNWASVDALLPLIESVRRHPAPGRQTGEGIASPLAISSKGGSGYRNDADTAANLIAPTPLVAAYRTSGNCGAWDTGDRVDALNTGTDPCSHLILKVFSIMPQNSGKDYKTREVDVAQPVMAGGPVGGNQGGDYVIAPAVAFAQNQRDELRCMDVAGALAAEPGMKQQTYVMQSAVRRLTPTECERLQGFPDTWTDIVQKGKPAADGPRYRAIGNSMAVPVLTYLLGQIEIVDQMS